MSVAGVHAAQLTGPIVEVLVNVVMDFLKVYGVEAARDRSDSKLNESKCGEVGLGCRELLRVIEAEFVFGAVVPSIVMSVWSIIVCFHLCQERSVDLVECRVTVNPRSEEAFKMLRWLQASEFHGGERGLHCF